MSLRKGVAWMRCLPSAKRRRSDESFVDSCKKRRCAETLPGHEVKIPHLAPDTIPSTSRGDRLVARQGRIQAAIDYERTHMSQEDYNHLYPLEIEGNHSDDIGSLEQRPRSKASRRRTGRQDEPSFNDPDKPPINKTTSKRWISSQLVHRQSNDPSC